MKWMCGGIEGLEAHRGRDVEFAAKYSEGREACSLSAVLRGRPAEKAFHQHQHFLQHLIVFRFCIPSE